MTNIEKLQKHLEDTKAKYAHGTLKNELLSLRVYYKNGQLYNMTEELAGKILDMMSAPDVEDKEVLGSYSP